MPCPAMPCHLRLLSHVAHQPHHTCACNQRDGTIYTSDKTQAASVRVSDGDVPTYTRSTQLGSNRYAGVELQPPPPPSTCTHTHTRTRTCTCTCTCTCTRTDLIETAYRFEHERDGEEPVCVCVCVCVCACAGRRDAGRSHGMRRCDAQHQHRGARDQRRTTQDKCSNRHAHACDWY